MPDGSSSEAPVTRPGPIARRYWRHGVRAAAADVSTVERDRPPAAPGSALISVTAATVPSPSGVLLTHPAGERYDVAVPHGRGSIPCNASSGVRHDRPARPAG